jgi:hypothetical protein
MLVTLMAILWMSAVRLNALGALRHVTMINLNRILLTFTTRRWTKIGLGVIAAITLLARQRIANVAMPIAQASLATRL